ncbi:MAG: phytanoyl-CoA dioxygenase family protein [Proteobacteria bacterium]|nr:phytanoyl-CoA dioxygenase family protein [Pseudomonadota bacterium]
MSDPRTTGTISAAEHARVMATYSREGEKRAHVLGNRGPIGFADDGKLDRGILEAYWQHGFYVFENVIAAAELAELRADVERVLAGAPVAPDGGRNRHGDPVKDPGFARPSFRWAKPLSDPVGGTTKNKGRHPVKMLDPTPSDGSPDWTIELLLGNLQLMPSCLRLYGHPGLLAVAEAVNGADFVPYNEVTFVKEPGLGPSVAWHQDGTTHWQAADWDEGAHGFNFMAQLYPSTAGNCVWVLPGSHKLGKVDIRLLKAQSGSERLDGAVPMLCGAGDVFITNRQLVHGSFANSSPDRRITLNAGFFPRRRVLNVTTSKLDGTVETYDADRIDERCRMIAIAADARQQRFPDEPRYCYQPLAGREVENRWNEQTRQSLVKDYNLQDLYI